MNELICCGDTYGDCDQPAMWLRHTQFAGTHPLCLLHAMKDSSFLVNDSYQAWEKIQIEETIND